MPENENNRRRVWTQEELKRAYNVDVIRQPRDERLICRVVSYRDEYLIKNNTLGGAYEAHVWLVELITRNSVPLRFPKEGLLEIKNSVWNRAFEEEIIEIEPNELRDRCTVIADSEGRILHFEMD